MSLKDNYPKVSHKGFLTGEPIFDVRYYTDELKEIWRNKIKSKVSEVLK